MIDWLHPGILLMAAALLVPLFRGAARKTFLVLATGAAMVDCFLMRPGAPGAAAVTHGAFRFLEYTLTFGRVDRLSVVFGDVFSLIAFIGIIYALHVEDWKQHTAALLYAGAALGAVYAGDLIVLYAFWEVMAFSSVFLVWLARNRKSTAAGFRYLLVHLFGGVCLLGGMVLRVSQTGSIAFDSLTTGGSELSFYLILAGFLLNAAAPPLSAWLPDAYPEATVTGTVFMSAFTTKTAVYVLARGFAGTEMLIWLGAVMTLYGIVYAVLENDIRRLLAYHIISQVGYMVCGIGIGTELAVNGAVAHAFAHILYKALLLMGAGAILQMTGRRKLTEMGGLARTMPLTMIFYMIAGFSISGVPLFSGFVSKSMIVAAAGEEHYVTIFIMLTVASCGTFFSTTLKLPYYAFWGKDAGLKAQDPPGNMRLGMGLAAALCIFIGVYPQALYNLLPFAVDFVPYTPSHLVSSVEMLLATGLVFALLLKYLAPHDYILLDTDWFYRKGARLLMWVVDKPLSKVEIDFVGPLHIRIFRAIRAIGQGIGLFDTRVVDGAVNGTAHLAVASAHRLRPVQSGSIRGYLLGMVVGAILLTIVLLLTR